MLTDNQALTLLTRMERLVEESKVVKNSYKLQAIDAEIECVSNLLDNHFRLRFDSPRLKLIKGRGDK